MALRAIQAAAPTWYAQTIPLAFHEAYAERQSDWRLSKKEVGVDMGKAGGESFWLLDHLDDNAPQQVLDLSEVGTLRTVWQQQFERSSGDGKTVVHQPPIKGKDIMQSPHEPEARWAAKRGQPWVGYKLQVTETAEDGEAEARFITDIDVIAANDGDSEVLDEIQERLIDRGLKPDEPYVDRGYVSGPNLAHSNGRGIELVGPALADTSRKPEGYKQGDFDIDFDACQVTCPQGRLAEAWRPYREGDGQMRLEVILGSQCHDCPARDPCAPGKKGRKLSLSPFYHYLYQRRAEQERRDLWRRVCYAAYAGGMRCMTANRLPPGSPKMAIQLTVGIPILSRKIGAPDFLAREMEASMSATSTYTRTLPAAPTLLRASPTGVKPTPV